MASDFPPPANRPVPPTESSSGEREAVDRLQRLLADPIVQLLMERDGVERDALLHMVRTVRSRAFRSGGEKPPSGE